MEENKKKVAIDADKLIKRVYNKIAIWNNQDATSEEKSIMLKVLSHDIVSDIISTAFSQLDGSKFSEQIVPGRTEKDGLFKKIFGKNKNK